MAKAFLILAGDFYIKRCSLSKVFSVLKYLAKIYENVRCTIFSDFLCLFKCEVTENNYAVDL